MPRYQIAQDSKLPGHFRVVDTHTQVYVSSAMTWESCEKLRDSKNVAYDHPGNKRRRIKTEILAAILICIAFALTMASGWDDSKTYALNHGTEVFE